MENVIENAAALQMTVEEILEERKGQLVNIDFKMVTFALAGKDYAIDILKVKEIAKAGRFTYVPNTAPFVIGVYNLRGEIIPVLDLRLFFNIDVPERTGNELESMIILRFEEQKYGIVVDTIDKVVGIQSAAIQPPHPLFGDINIKYISGVIENAGRLYILLDVDRIFGVKTSASAAKESSVLAYEGEGERRDFAPGKVIPARLKMDEVLTQAVEKTRAGVLSARQNAEISAAKKTAGASTVSVFSFIEASLRAVKQFYISPINSEWASRRYGEWISERGEENAQFINEEDVDAFLEPFFSRDTEQLWSEKYAEAIYSVLPDNNAKQIQVWNPGCGSGYEAYSLVCLLKKRYPAARIKIYAQDTDLIAISNAPLLQFLREEVSSWYEPYLVKAVSGDYVFAADIRDSIFFEYHDCTNTNSIPAVDLIFARDFLSYMSEDTLYNVLTDFDEKIKGNGIVIIGDNEALPDQSRWFSTSKGSITTYTKQ